MKKMELTFICGKMGAGKTTASIGLASAKNAVLHYKGAYSAIKVAYDYLYGDWLPKSGREPMDAPPYEMYLNIPEDTAEDDLLTELFLPIVNPGVA